jgi:archaellum component FlaC
MTTSVDLAGLKSRIDALATQSEKVDARYEKLSAAANKIEAELRQKSGVLDAIVGELSNIESEAVTPEDVADS